MGFHHFSVGHHVPVMKKEIVSINPPPDFQHSRYSRLVLRSVSLISVLSLAAISLYEVYNYAQEKVALKESLCREVRSLRPLYSNGQPMTREWARKAIMTQEYTESWYKSIGNGVVTVFMWTFL